MQSLNRTVKAVDQSFQKLRQSMAAEKKKEEEAKKKPEKTPLSKIKAKDPQTLKLDKARSVQEALLDFVAAQSSAIYFIAAVGEPERVGYVTPNIETILGHTPASVVSDPAFFRAKIHGDDLEDFSHQRGEAMARRRRPSLFSSSSRGGSEASTTSTRRSPPRKRATSSRGRTVAESPMRWGSPSASSSAVRRSSGSWGSRSART